MLTTLKTKPEKKPLLGTTENPNSERIITKRKMKK